MAFPFNGFFSGDMFSFRMVSNFWFKRNMGEKERKLMGKIYSPIFFQPRCFMFSGQKSHQHQDLLVGYTFVRISFNERDITRLTWCAPGDNIVIAKHFLPPNHMSSGSWERWWMGKLLRRESREACFQPLRSGGRTHLSSSSVLSSQFSSRFFFKWRLLWGNTAQVRLQPCKLKHGARITEKANDFLHDLKTRTSTMASSALELVGRQTYELGAFFGEMWTILFETPNWRSWSLLSKSIQTFHISWHPMPKDTKEKTTAGTVCLILLSGCYFWVRFSFQNYQIQHNLFRKTHGYPLCVGWFFTCN